MENNGFIANINKVANNLEELKQLTVLPDQLNNIKNSAQNAYIQTEQVKSETLSIFNDTIFERNKVVDKVAEAKDFSIDAKNEANKAKEISEQIQDKINQIAYLPSIVNNSIAKSTNYLEDLCIKSKGFADEAKSISDKSKIIIEQFKEEFGNLVLLIHRKIDDTNLLKNEANNSVANLRNELSLAYEYLNRKVIQKASADDEINKLNEILDKVEKIYTLILAQANDIDKRVKQAEACAKSCEDYYERASLSIEESLCTFPNFSIGDDTHTAIPNTNTLYFFTKTLYADHCINILNLQ